MIKKTVNLPKMTFHNKFEEYFQFGRNKEAMNRCYKPYLNLTWSKYGLLYRHNKINTMSFPNSYYESSYISIVYYFQII